jgi:hypothetical protein
MTLVLAGIGVKHDDAMVGVAVSVKLVGFRIDEGLGRQPEILKVISALALPGLANLHQELAIAA